MSDTGRAPNGVDDTAFLQALFDTASSVTIPHGDYIVSALTWPSSLLSVTGEGRVTITHKADTDGAMISPGSDRITNFRAANLTLIGNDEEGETCGWDLTGFSYGHIENVRVTNFRADGLYAKGDTTPTSRQVSNLVLVGCSSKNNTGHGLTLADATGQANTALQFYGCEFAGNGGDGVHIDKGSSCLFSGCTLQGNTGYDLYCDGDQNRFEAIYFEHTNANPSIAFGSGSVGNSLSLAHLSYTLSTSLVDDGVGNVVIHHMGGEGLDLFGNADLADETSFLPTGMTKVGAFTPESAPDGPTNAVRFPLGGGFRGVDITLSATYAELAGRYVTVALLARNNMPAGADVRCYTLVDAGGVNSTNGEFVRKLGVGTSGAYERMIFDVRFAAANVSTSPAKIKLYLLYEGYDAETVNWDIGEVRVLLGVRYLGNTPIVSI